MNQDGGGRIPGHWVRRKRVPEAGRRGRGVIVQMFNVGEFQGLRHFWIWEGRRGRSRGHEPGEDDGPCCWKPHVSSVHWAA